MLNKSFIGSWGQESLDNIPHEIINMFRSDNGQLYIYVPPYGGYDIKQHPDVDYILLTSSWNRNTTEVLYVIKGLTRLHNGGKKATPEDKAQLAEYIKRNNIRYGGKYLHEIKMAAQEEAITFYMTFHAETIQKPKRKLFLTWNNEPEIHNEKKDLFVLPSNYNYQRLFGYLPPEDSIIANAIIQDSTLWDDVQISPVSTQSAIQQEPMNMVKLMHKVYDENVYTSLFYEFFNACPKLFTKFSQDILGIQTDETFIIKKEITTADKKGRLDLLAEGPHSVIAIENKLQSGLHGIDKHHKLSQLTTYINFIEKDILNGRNGYYFLFEPDYNNIDIAFFDSQRGLEWKKCQYSRIHKFMQENRTLLLQSPLEPYADDFISALSMHTQQLKDIVENRFLDAIHSK